MATASTMGDMAYVAREALPALPPPPGVARGFWQRQLDTYFGTPANALMTLVSLAAILWFFPKFIDWAVLRAVWSGETGAACRVEGAGACWAFVREKFWFSIFGLYPYELRWRPGAVLVVFGVMVAISVQRRFWRKELTYAWLAALAVMWGLQGGTIPLVGVPLPDFSKFNLFQTMVAIGLAIVIVIGFVQRERRAKITIIGLSTAAFLLFFAANPFVMLGILSPIPKLEEVPSRLWGGVPITIFLAVFGLAVAYPIGVLLALGRRSDLPIVKAFCIVWIEFIRGVPLISLLFMAIFILPLFLAPGVDIDRFLRAQVAFIIFAAAYLAEVFRGGLQAIPKGQYEAADAVGLGYWTKMRLVVLPQALKITIPAQVNTFIGLFKDTTLVVIIGVFDFFTTLRTSLGDPNWLGFATEAYLYAATAYFIACYFMSKYSRKLEVILNPERRR